MRSSQDSMSMFSNASNGPPGTYEAIAETIAEEIESGRLPPGARLPPQRDVAQRLRVALTTVTRAYAEVRRRGLIEGQVGRGTFVRTPAGDMDNAADSSGLVDLSTNVLEPRPFATAILDSLIGLRYTTPRWLGYAPEAGLSAHREKAATLLQANGLEATTDRTLITAGAQHAIAAALAATTTPGSIVLTEAHTYPGMLAAARQANVQCHGIAMDADGIRPDSLRTVCRKTGSRVLYCIPTLQNPTCSVMSEARRRDIAKVAQEADVTIIEDDVYGFLIPNVRPLAFFAPQRTLYIASAAKSITPSLRIGFLLAPVEWVERLAHALWATAVCASPLLAEIVLQLYGEGVAKRILEWKRKEAGARQDLVSQHLKGLSYRSYPTSQHVWLNLSGAWSAQDFASRARSEGLLVSPAASFAVGRAHDKAIRICIGSPATRMRLEDGLKIIASMLRRGPKTLRAVI